MKREGSDMYRKRKGKEEEEKEGGKARREGVKN